MSRYFDQDTTINQHTMYRKKLKRRGVIKIEHYKTPEFTYVSPEDLDSIESYEYVWKYGDTFWRLASNFYNAPEEWWVIARFNNKPTECHVKVGETIKIPVNLGEFLRYL